MNHTTRAAIAQFLDLVLNWLLTGLVFIVPLFFLPITSEIFFVNKHLLFFAGVSLALLLWAGTFIARGKVQLTIHPLLLPLALLTILSIASVLVNKVSLAEALVGRTGLITALFFFVLIGSSRQSNLSIWLTRALVSSSILLALGTVLSFSGLMGNFQLFSWMSGKTFTAAGTMSALAVLLVGTLPLIVHRLRPASPLPALSKLALTSVTIVMLAGAVIASILIFPGQGAAPTRMPIAVGWQIAVETLKQQPFFGVGAGNYLSAYTKYRPITINTTPLWNQRFQQAPNEFLNEFTETGLLGLLVLLFLIWKIYDLLRLGTVDGVTAALFTVILSLFLFPLNVISMLQLSALLTILVLNLKTQSVLRDQVYDATLGVVAFREGLVGVQKTPPHDQPLSGIRHALTGLQEARHGKSAGILALIFSAPLLAAGGLSLFLISRAWAAEIIYKQALDAISQNNGTMAYNRLIQTLTLNPLFDTYHRQYADINLRLANALAGQSKLSDQDRANVSQLVQQAIREAKIAAQLNPTDVRNWEELAAIYRAIINVADGARDWTVIAYSEAIRLDPYNPVLRVDVGGVFYNAKDWENAITSFQTAVNIKPDYANGYYNLALAYEQDNRLKEALRAIQATVQHVEANSADYSIAQQKLDDLTKKAQQANRAEPKTTAGTEPTSEERLSPPQPIPTPLPGANRVKLSQEEAPPPTSTPIPTPGK